jgi:hypothetical protein
MKKIIVITCLVFLLMIAVFAYLFYRSVSSHPISDLFVTQTSTPKPTCSGLTIQTPTKNQTISSPLEITAVVDNRNPLCNWRVYEAQAGTIEIKDTKGNIVGKGVLQTEDNWMQAEPVTYHAALTFSKPTTQTKAILTITEENPAGKPDAKSVSLPLLLE